MFTLGVTGGIGCGKSFVTSLFEDRGVFVVDADHVAREVVTPGQPALKEIANHFGSDIIRADGQLDRGKLREIIFADPQDKRWLELLLHPLIRQEVANALQSPKLQPYQIYSAPLLLEQNQMAIVDKLLVVDCPVEVQIARVTARDESTESDVKRIIAQQVSREYRLEKADFIIDNSGGKSETRKQVDSTHEVLLANYAD